MYLLLALCLALAYAGQANNHEQMFHQFMAKYNKVYLDEDEYTTRLTNFIEGMKKAEELNRRSRELNSTATFGVTKFSDLTAAEFKSLLRTKLGQTDSGVPVADIPNVAPPNAFDWRDHHGITGQKNEEQCGSCWAMTVVMAIESAYMIHRNKINQQPLSTQQIIDCDTSDDGCNGGEPTTAYMYVVGAQGLATNAYYPYTGQDGTCRNISMAEKQDPILGYELVIPANSKNELAMASFLASNQPISTAVDAEQWQYYTGGVFMASQCGTEIDHGVQIIGYDGLNAKGWWVIRNMWGSDWGENGFIRLQWGMNTCGLTSLPTAPTLAKQ